MLVEKLVVSVPSPHGPVGLLWSGKIMSREAGCRGAHGPCAQSVCEATFPVQQPPSPGQVPPGHPWDWPIGTEHGTLCTASCQEGRSGGDRAWLAFHSDPGSSTAT